MFQHIVEMLRTSRSIAAKADIAGTVARLGLSGRDTVRVGDDCAAIADGDGYLLLAIEGFINEFVAADPWFAGWCGVMVNISDIAAMGGRPIAVVERCLGQRTTRQPIRSYKDCAPHRKHSACRWSAGTPTFVPTARNSLWLSWAKRNAS